MSKGGKSRKLSQKVVRMIAYLQNKQMNKTRLRLFNKKGERGGAAQPYQPFSKRGKEERKPRKKKGPPSTKKAEGKGKRASRPENRQVHTISTSSCKKGKERKGIGEHSSSISFKKGGANKPK